MKQKKNSTPSSKSSTYPNTSTHHASPQHDTVLFDFDGCIADTLPLWLESFRRTFAQLEISISDRMIIDTAFHRWDLVAERLGIRDIEDFGTRLYTHFHDLTETVQTHQDVPKTLRALKKRGIKTAVVTSTHRATAEHLLESLGTRQYFDCVVGWEDTTNNKPHPEPVLFAMEQLKSNPQKTIMIGDSQADLIAGNEASVTTVWFFPPSHVNFYQREIMMRHQPNFIIPHMYDLMTIV